MVGRDDLIRRTRELLERLEHGCSDHNCEFRQRFGGIGTNGGCHCRRDLADGFVACAILAEGLPRSRRHGHG
jgi:hypothetical protein